MSDDIKLIEDDFMNLLVKIQDYNQLEYKGMREVICELESIKNSENNPRHNTIDILLKGQENDN